MRLYEEKYFRFLIQSVFELSTLETADYDRVAVEYLTKCQPNWLSKGTLPEELQHPNLLFGSFLR